MRRLSNSEHVAHIRLQRQRYNAAISKRNVDEICAFFTQDYHVITARGLQSHGIEEQHKRWSAVFAEDPVVIYRRNTKGIRLSEETGAAQEHGYWAGKYLFNQNVTLLGGVYSAKWLKQANGLWLVQAEIFTMLKCRSFALDVSKITKL
jgi:ketosteroid isomerase-like protein